MAGLWHFWLKATYVPVSNRACSRSQKNSPGFPGLCLHVDPYKPCFVPEPVQARVPSVIIYLSVAAVLPSLQFAWQNAPTKSLGYSLAGFTRSTVQVSLNVSSLWHFSDLLTHNRSLSVVGRRNRSHGP